MPALEAQLDRLNNCHTQALAISVDSQFVHANFGASVGGISYPILADFHPKGAVGDAYGVYLADKGIIARATVIVDAKGIVRHASVGSDQRDMEKLVAVCEEVDRAHDLPNSATPATLPAGACVYVRDNCAASRAVLLARTNLHLDKLAVKNVSQDAGALKELKDLSGAETAPVLVAEGAVQADSAAIIARLAG